MDYQRHKYKLLMRDALPFFNPSLTRPKLLAIMTAVLVTFSRLYVHIYTNNQAAIDGINKINNIGIRHDCKFLKSNNYIILFIIHDIIKIKRLKFTLHKVKGHSGCYWNNIANSITKLKRETVTINTNKIINLQDLYNFSFPLIFLPTWLSWHYIEINRHVWHFCKIVSELLDKVAWSFNNHWRALLNHQYHNKRNE